jgi:hypothetical protein
VIFLWFGVDFEGKNKKINTEAIIFETNLDKVILMGSEKILLLCINNIKSLP